MFGVELFPWHASESVFHAIHFSVRAVAINGDYSKKVNAPCAR